LLCAWLAFAFSHGVAAQDGEPVSASPPDQAVASIERFHAVLLDTMRDAKRLGVEGRYRKLEPAIRATFDLPAMARIAVGPSWTGLSAATQNAISDAFARMSIATYANRFDGYSGERFVVQPDAERRGRDVIVQSKLITSGREPIALNYLMRSAGSEWKIIDVYLNGTVSELATRRTEFVSVLKTKGGDALAADLRARADRLLSEAG